MAIAGRVAIVPKGDWSADSTYKRLDAVTYNNTLYFAKKEVPAGTATSNTEYWSKSIVGGACAIATTEDAGIVKPDGTTITVDEDGTLHGSSSVDEMTGATADKDGTSGTVPAPMAGQENRVLKGNGAWEALAYDSELSAESENAPQTKVVDAKTKEIEENLSQLSNPNLFINPDFRINQRGGKIVESGKNYYSDESCGTLVSTTTSAYTATKISNGNYSISIDSTTYYVKASDVVDGYCETLKYTVDRWENYNGKVEVLNKGIKSDSTVYQLIENSDNLLGKTVTLSAKIDGVVKSGTCTLPSQYNGDTIDLVLNVEFDNANIRIFVENNNKRIQGCSIESKNGNTFIAEWVKLEFGSVATPFVPPDPASELLKCQRYYEKGYGYYNSAVGSVGAIAVSNIEFKATKRITPTISLTLHEGNYNGINLDQGLSYQFTTTKNVQVLGTSTNLSPYFGYTFVANAEIY